jgi:hypothetical protein
MEHSRHLLWTGRETSLRAGLCPTQELLYALIAGESICGATMMLWVQKDPDTVALSSVEEAVVTCPKEDWMYCL